MPMDVAGTGFIKRPWNAVIDLLATDATRIIKAAPGAGFRLVVTRWSYQSVTSAAQLITISDGTTVIGRLPASIAAGTMLDLPSLDKGVPMALNTALSITPAAAGPAGLVICEGYLVEG